MADCLHDYINKNASLDILFSTNVLNCFTMPIESIDSFTAVILLLGMYSSKEAN